MNEQQQPGTDRQQPTGSPQGQTFHAPNTGWANGYRQPGQPPYTAPQPGAEKSVDELERELEAQVRAFSESVTQSFRYGFDAHGQELGSRAKGLGFAVADMVGYGLSQGKRALELNLQNQQGGAYRYAGGQRQSQPKNQLSGKANLRFGIGLAQVITGGVMAFSLLLAGIICLGVSPFTIDSGGALTLGITGACLTVAGLPFLWLTARGSQSLKASGRLRAYGGVFGGQQAAPLALLAQAAQRSIAQTKKDIRRMTRRGWLTAWLDEESDTLYLSEVAYTQAQQQKQQAAAQAAQTAEKQDADAKQEKTSLTLQNMENFVTVLRQEKQMMADDPQAVEELERMAVTSTAILEWVKTHPESQPKARRLAEYYIPTTLKLLATYNEVKRQNGENAQSIRRDIAGMLHTLNTAFQNLHDNLLADVAMDVSSEIAALQGMLAQDGLSAQDDVFGQYGAKR